MDPVVFPLWFLGPAAFWVVVLVVAIVLLRREPPGRYGPGHPSALRTLEERYARGEIAREEFIERRAVLLGHPTPTQPPGTQPPRPDSPDVDPG
jgi:uncharacterized membrane protein